MAFFMRTDDPIADAIRLDELRENEAQQYPVCACCKERIIQENTVQIFGKWVCDTCLEEKRQDTSVY